MIANLVKVSLCSTLATLCCLQSNPAWADHLFDHRGLLPAVQSLHHKVQHFEQLACQRPFPRHELTFIRLMTGKSCRLADGVRDCARHARIKVDYRVLNTFTRVVDKRLQKHCASHYDHQLMRCWKAVLCEAAAVGCAINGCPSGCKLHRAPPPPRVYSPGPVNPHHHDAPPLPSHTDGRDLRRPRVVPGREGDFDHFRRTRRGRYFDFQSNPPPRRNRGGQRFQRDFPHYEVSLPAAATKSLRELQLRHRID